MVKTNSQRALTILIFTALAVAVGCGDGKRNMRGSVNRANGGSDKAALNKPSAGATGTAGKTGETGGAAAPTATAADNNKVNKQIDTIYAAQITGASIQPQAVEAGTYELATVSTDFQFGDNSNLAVRALRTDEVAPNQPLHTLADQTSSFGDLASIDGGRNVQLPFRFTAEDGGLKIKKANDDWVYLNKVEKDAAGKIGMTASFGQVAGTQITASLADLVAGASVDNKQIPASLTIVRADAGTIRFVMTFFESGKVASKNNDKTALVNTRSIVLTYKKSATKQAEGGETANDVIKTNAPTTTGNAPDVDAI